MFVTNFRVIWYHLSNQGIRRSFPDYQIDLGFIADSSLLQGQRSYLKAVTNAFNISPGNTHVGFIVFSDYAKIAFPFDADYTGAGVRQLIDGIQVSSSREKRIDLALQMAYRDLFTSRNGARPGARQVSKTKIYPPAHPTPLQNQYIRKIRNESSFLSFLPVLKWLQHSRIYSPSAHKKRTVTTW